VADTGTTTKWGRRAGTTVVAAAAAIASYAFQTQLAQAAGWGDVAPLYPLTIDALGGTALLVYRDTMSRYAQAVMGIAAAGTIVSNAFGHYYTQPDAPVPGTVAVTVVGAVPAISLILISHLAVQTQREPQPWTRTQPQSRPTPTTVTATTVTTAAATPTTSADQPQPQPATDLAALIRQTWPDGQYPGLQRMAKQLGVGVPRIRAAKATLNGHSEVQP